MSVISIIVAILIFGFIIFFHELGHFLVARKCGIRVNEFSLGLGPTLFGFTRGETKYSIKLLPFGGACSMEGEDEDSDDERAFNKKPLWQRALVVFAGPGFNFILAFIVAVIILGAAGVDKPILVGVTEGLPAEEAGIEAGDKIVRLGNYDVNFFREITIYTRIHEGEPIDVTYERDGQRYVTTILPEYDEDAGRYLLGVEGSGGRERVGPIETIGYAFCEVRYQIYSTIKSLGMLLTGRLSVNELSGPVGIVKVIGQTYEQSLADGVFYVVMNMLNFAVLLSANLGIMNLLPIPALDGGRLLVFLVEAIRRKKLPVKVEGAIHMVGFFILIALMIFVFFNDIRKLIMGG